jgi:predicted glycogen debranching enzyme
MIYAGYHWFVEPWGRDTFVSLPGLLLEQGKFNEAKFIFKSFAKMIRKGLVPNKAPDIYNASDATLWFLHALKEYMKMRGSDSFIRDMKPLIEEILFTYPENDVASLNNDLISVAPCSTWMDTRFTPRSGKPVEVNALWIEALQFAELLDISVPVSSEKSRKAFSRFWNPQSKYLYDVIDPLDTSLRPNQVIPIALGLVDREVALLSLDSIRCHLLTPFG